MKIAICIYRSSVGGVSTSTYILAKGMREAGYEVDILATSHKAGEDYDRARQDGWPVEAICAGELWLRKRLKITLERLTQYDVVINNHSIETQLVLPALPSSTIRLSVVRSVNDSVILGAKVNSRWVDALVGISPEVCRLLKEIDVDCSIHMIPNACMMYGEKFNKIASPLQIIYIGRLSDIDKNILILPDIVRSLDTRGANFSLIIGGDGPDRSRFQQKARELDVDARMLFLGSVSHDDVGELFGRSHFAVFPSNYEGFGLTLIEAMAVGCVPIVSDIPAYRWILGKDGPLLTAPIKEAETYADRLLAVAHDPDLYVSLQKRLRQRQQENFTPEATVGRYLDLICELRDRHSTSNFRPVPLSSLDLPRYHRIRYTRFWRLLQVIRYGSAA